MPKSSFSWETFKKFIVWIGLVPALVLSGCSVAPEDKDEPVGLSSVTWEELSETAKYKEWIDAKTCQLDNIEEIVNLEFLPIKVGESAPTPREIMVSRTGRIMASMGTQDSRLKMLREISDWDEYSNTHSDTWSRVWMNPDSAMDQIYAWVLTRFEDSLSELSDEFFSFPVREKIRQAWLEMCENDTIIEEVRTVITQYDAALEGLIQKVVSDFEKKGYKQFFDHILIKRTGKKTEDGWRYLTYSAVQFRYCAVGYSKVVYRFEFVAPGLVDADGIKAEDLIGEASREDANGVKLGTVREYLLMLNGVNEEENDYSGLKVIATWPAERDIGTCH